MLAGDEMRGKRLFAVLLIKGLQNHFVELPLGKSFGKHRVVAEAVVHGLLLLHPLLEGVF